jgi:hypothetical protein
MVTPERETMPRVKSCLWHMEGHGCTGLQPWHTGRDKALQSRATRVARAKESRVRTVLGHSLIQVVAVSVDYAADVAYIAE